MPKIKNHVQENDIIIDDATHNHKAILEKYNTKNRNNLNFMPKQPWNNKLKSIFRGDILEIANKIKENFENNITNNEKKMDGSGCMRSPFNCYNV